MKDLRETKIGEERIYEGKIVNLRIDRVRLPNGREATREVVEHPGAVGILAFTAADRILLLRQYRAATGEILWEIPAGKLDSGEDPLNCARRELEEETGYTAGEWASLVTYYTTPGFSNEIMHIYTARNLVAGSQKTDEDEFVEVQEFSLDEAWEMVTKGEIKDAKTIIAISLAVASKKGSGDLPRSGR